jgi:hypothetical protein
MADSSKMISTLSPGTLLTCLNCRCPASVRKICALLSYPLGIDVPEARKHLFCPSQEVVHVDLGQDRLHHIPEHQHSEDLQIAQACSSLLIAAPWASAEANVPL